MKLSLFADEALAQMSDNGAFLVSGDSENYNGMTIGWGSFSVYFGKPIIIVPVRLSRQTHEFMEKYPTFTVSVPERDAHFDNALKVFGSKSGRDCDKFALAELNAAKAKRVETPVVEGCKLYYECKTIYSELLELDRLPKEIVTACFAKGDPHRLYFGEILESYRG